jgi:ribosomal protein S18 acetylase RimI-like enzyme
MGDAGGRRGPACVRQARPEDHGRLCALFAELDRFHRAAWPDVFAPPPPDGRPARSPEHVAGQLGGGGDGRGTILVAECGGGGELAGLAVLVEKAVPASPVRPARRFVEVENLAVAERHRGAGIGRLLMRHAELWARGRGVDVLELSVWEFNRGALGFYEGLGFETATRRMTRRLGEEGPPPGLSPAAAPPPAPAGR